MGPCSCIFPRLWGSPVSLIPSQHSLLQAHARAATSAYPQGSDHPQGTAVPSLPTYLSGGDQGSLCPASSSSSSHPACQAGMPPGNWASFMAASSPKHIKFV